MSILNPLTFAIIATILVLINAHPCKRECDGRPMTCRYHFKVETYHSLGYPACGRCPEEIAHCFVPECIVAGGVQRNLITVNRQMPGPAIEVCLGDTVEVVVENIQLNGEATTIHWHGQSVRGTPYMDGVPWVTQCPVQSNNNFTYRLTAAVAGTHFWHSAQGVQRGDGMFGMFVVRVPNEKEPYYALYDRDEHQISITDWTRKTRLEAYGDFAYGGKTPAPDGILINGLGVMMDVVDVDYRFPLATLHVRRGLRYRLRFVNAGYFDCPVSVSIDNHPLTVISSDGRNIQAQVVNSFNILAGERYDFILVANQTVNAYWMRVKGLGMCNEHQLFQVGILHYEGATRDPTAAFPNYETAAPRTGVVLNPLFGNETESIRVDQLKNLNPIDPDLRTSRAFQMFLQLSVDLLTSPTGNIFTPHINQISYKEANIPLLMDRNNANTVCKYENKINCEGLFCRCTHVIELPANRIVELVVYDTAALIVANQSIHLHGQGFHVMGWKRLGNQITSDQIADLNQRQMLERNMIDPIEKDTVAVPSGGYVVLRFKTDNPGFWKFHTFVDSYGNDGMRLVFKVGNAPSPPRGFPQCINYLNN